MSERVETTESVCMLCGNEMVEGDNYLCLTCQSLFTDWVICPNCHTPHKPAQDCVCTLQETIRQKDERIQQLKSAARADSETIYMLEANLRRAK